MYCNEWAHVIRFQSRLRVYNIYGQTNPSVASTVASCVDSDAEVDPFVNEEERDDLLGELYSDMEEDEEEKVDECPEGPSPKRTKIVVSPKTLKLLKSATSQPLKNDKRKTITNKFPLHSCDHAQLDEDISCVIPKSAKTYDRYLSKLQQFTLDALGPITWLYEQVVAGDMVDPSKAKKAVEASIALLGNSAAHLSAERRKSLMKHLNKDLRPLCEGKFPNRGPYLFGEDFGSRAKKTSDNIRALKGISSSKDRFSRFGDSNKGKQPQSRRPIWGKNSQSSQNSVFSRLGPSKQFPKFNKSNANIKKQS